MRESASWKAKPIISSTLCTGFLILKLRVLVNDRVFPRLEGRVHELVQRKFDFFSSFFQFNQPPVLLLGFLLLALLALFPLAFALALISLYRRCVLALCLRTDT